MSYYPHTVYPEPIGLDHDSTDRFCGADPAAYLTKAHRSPSPHRRWRGMVGTIFGTRHPSHH